MNRRPLSVTIVACIYILVGVAGFVFHFNELLPRHGGSTDAIYVELVELLAILCGAFMMRGHNWARWGALGWIALHVVLSAFHALQEFAVHCLFAAVIAWALLRPEAGRYFGGGGVEPPK
jgi:hypothetical protein